MSNEEVDKHLELIGYCGEVMYSSVLNVNLFIIKINLGQK